MAEVKKNIRGLKNKIHSSHAEMLSLTSSEFETNFSCQSFFKRPLRDVVNNHLKEIPLECDKRYLWALFIAYVMCGQSPIVQLPGNGS